MFGYFFDKLHYLPYVDDYFLPVKMVGEYQNDCVFDAMYLKSHKQNMVAGNLNLTTTKKYPIFSVTQNNFW